MSKLNNEVARTLEVECYDIVRIINDSNDLTNEDLYMMISDLKYQLTTLSNKLRKEL